MTEGAAALVLEDWDRAVARGATIYAEVAGAASTADAHHITAPAPDGSGAVGCMELALADAGIAPSNVGHINVHGTSTPLNDLAEARAITKVFGEPGPLVTSTKGVTGHGLAAAGAIEAVAAVLTIDRAIIPPTAGYASPTPRSRSRSSTASPGPGSPLPCSQFLRLRRPQRLPGAAAPWLSAAGKVTPPLPPRQRLVRSVDGKAANLGCRVATLPRCSRRWPPSWCCPWSRPSVVLATGHRASPAPSPSPSLSTCAVALGDSVPYRHGLANPYLPPQVGLPTYAVSQGPSTEAYPSLAAVALRTDDDRPGGSTAP